MRATLRARAYVLGCSVGTAVAGQVGDDGPGDAWANHVEAEILDIVAQAVQDARDEWVAAAPEPLSSSLPR